jgi:nitrite reductase (NO-forming)
VVGVKQAMIITLIIGALLLAACGGKQPAQRPAQPPAAQPPAQQPAAPIAAGQRVRVEMTEFKYTMGATEVPAGTVSFELVNAGAVEHSFIIEGTDTTSEQIRPGQTVTVQTELKPGTYTVICDVVGHKEAGMTAQLTVK